MCDVKDVGYDDLVALHGPCSVKLQQIACEFVLFNQICLLVHWKSKRKATWPMPLHQTCQLTLWNFISQDCYIANATYMPCRQLLCHCSCNINACWPTPLLFKHAYWLSAAARWTLAGLQPLNQHVCRPFVTQYCISAGVVLLYLLYLLVWCLTISCACWCGASYRSYLLVWYITISHACWCGASLEVMPSYVVPHCRSCLLVWCLIKCHACWRGTSL